MKSKLLRNSRGFALWGYPAGVLLAGSVWGVGLSRLLAELCGVAEFQVSWWPTAGLAVMCAALLYFAWRWVLHCSWDWRALLPLLFPALYVVGAVDTPLGGVVLLAGGLLLFALLVWKERPRWVPLAILALVVFGTYLKTLLPSLGEADTFEFQVVAPLLGIAHPTGYPLYVLLSRLFTLLPFGTVAWRVNMTSACFGTGAVLLVYGLVYERTGEWLIAFATALALAFSTTFWSQAIVAEVYMLHNLLAAAILWFLLDVTHGKASQGASDGTDIRRWQATAFLCGLSLTNHLTTVLLLPAVALALLWERPRMRSRDWLVTVVLALLGSSFYLFIPLRWPALNEGQWMSLREFLAYITGGRFHDALRLDGWRDPLRWQIVTRLILDPYGLAAVLLAGAGVVGLMFRDRKSLVLTGVTFLTFVIYGVNYYVPDISVFLLPAHLILAIWLGEGLFFLVDTVSRVSGARITGVSLLAGVLLVLLPMMSLWQNLPVVDQSSNSGREEWGRYVLNLPLKSDAAVLADVKKFAPLYYVQQVEGLRPDLDLVLLGTEELYQRELGVRLEASQPVYLARYLPHLEGLWLRSVGPVTEVGTDPWMDEALPDTRLDIQFGDSLCLVGFDIADGAESAQRLLRLTLYWQPKSPLVGDYVVAFRLLDLDGVVRWESGAQRPVSGLYPTNAWREGQTVSDYHELIFPSHLSPGMYTVQVGMFPQLSRDGLPADSTLTSWVDLALADVGVDQVLPSLPSRASALFGESLWMTGYDLPSQATAGSDAMITVGWRTASSVPGQGPGTDLFLDVNWVSDTEVINGVDDELLRVTDLGGGIGWYTLHSVAVPAEPGRYHLAVELQGSDGQRLRAICGWLKPATDGCSLASIDVLSEYQGLARFEDLFLLQSATIGVDPVTPGGIVPVSLDWRALRTVTDDFTAFVHLIGPDGRLHGQVDAWPVQGTFPTSEWNVAIDVLDSYEVRLDGDAPSGIYRIAVGWYLLATMQRLEVVGVDGDVIGDSFTVGEFDVQ
ncbi:MAG: DUF2723 domain-containing protein [Anaerolineae bacterium]|nr:DUF2723 domain-containing protein [Anaerolineae bacterium]